MDTEQPEERDFVVGTKHYLRRLSYSLVDVTNTGETIKDEKQKK